MAFVYERPGKARDIETDTEISRSFGFRDGVQTFSYTLRHKNICFQFEVIPYDMPFDHINPKTGASTVGRVTVAAYIMEQNFRQGLERAFLGAGPAGPTDAEYEHYKRMVDEGLTVLITSGEQTLQHLTQTGFRVEFEDDVHSYAAKYPDRLKGYVRPKPRLKR